MTSSADVASHAGVSRSTVSQILNGHDHRFTPDMVLRVRQAAEDLGYRPSVAGRTLVRGTSDIVITLIPDVTIGPPLRELIDLITQELATAGYTNLLRLASTGASFEDAVLGLRPMGVVSLAPLSPDQRTRLEAQNVRVVEQSLEVQIAIDGAIGRLQAAHLGRMGYSRIAAAMPLIPRELPFATARAQGVRDWCEAEGVQVVDTLHIDMARGAMSHPTTMFGHAQLGVAAYNDDVAMAVVGAASKAGLRVPADIGVIGVDNADFGGVSSPTLSTIKLDLALSSHAIVEALVRGDGLPTSSLEDLSRQFTVIQGESSALTPSGRRPNH
ncbi:MAG: LacI family DNA-binding transcriptional regulator [Actinobacteria bacterium]|nr:LacI family DNA-binding transcriptional regulator [Actinomycetota bacterium]